MKKIKSFLDLAVFILNYKQEALSEVEIWNTARELIESEVIEFVTDGKTPWQTISARIYMDIKNNPDKTKFVRLIKPKRFILREYLDKQVEDACGLNQFINNSGVSGLEHKLDTERDLHKYLTVWLAKEKNIYTKTIFHERSLKNKVRNGEIKTRWLYPDMIGVEFSFSYVDEVTKLVNNLGISLIKLYSYELKKELNASNIRECYFQAVSNSSWANEGYLVVEKISLDQAMLDELQRLNNAFGIGVIQLYTKDKVFDTEVLLPSRVKNNIDIETLDHLAIKNPDIQKVIKAVNEIVEIKKTQKDISNQQLYIDAQIEQYFDKVEDSLVNLEE